MKTFKEFITEAMGTYTVSVYKMIRGKQKHTNVKVRANSEDQAIEKAKKVKNVEDAWDAIEIDTPLPSQKNKKPKENRITLKNYKF